MLDSGVWTVSVRYIVDDIVEVDELEPVVNHMCAAGVNFRNEIVTGRGGRQILADDPSGNAVELFRTGRSMIIP